MSTGWQHAGVHELVARDHEVFVKRTAGVGSSITDEEYLAAGARILGTSEDVWAAADLILKVTEPAHDACVAESHSQRFPSGGADGSPTVTGVKGAGRSSRATPLCWALDAGRSTRPRASVHWP